MDIVERLRDTTGIHEELMYEAADMIERAGVATHITLNQLRGLMLRLHGCGRR